MHDNTAVQMMRRCLETIEEQRARIAYLAPKAEAYDRIGALLDLTSAGNRQLVGAGEDVAWQLRREIETAEERMREEKRGQDTRRPAEPPHVVERERDRPEVSEG
jgi:hypothetical protein